MQDGQKSKLSLHSSGNDKSGERISIFIKKCKNLVRNDSLYLSVKIFNTFFSSKVTQKAEGLTLYAKIDFNENQIAESQKIQITPDSVPDLNFNASLNVVATDQSSIDDIAYKPIISN